MAEIGEPAERPIQVPAPWRWPKPRREESPPVQVPAETPRREEVPA